MLALALVVLGVLSRFIIHVDNFTPLIAIALFAGLYLPRKQAIIVPLSIFIIYDIFIQFHSLIFFTWGSVVLIALIGLKARKNKSFLTVTTSALGSAVLFFIITNFAVWVFYDTYPKSMAGLVQCYVAAIPYFRMTLLSTVVYTAVFCGGYELLAARLRNTKLAHVL